ncbi:MAG TPA: RluA family pseudouridine synthase [Verrucomicrobiae bacterium]|nr:RluA family pseudouridine synthase [Verrucomicrobiae bacterium]
MAKPDSIDLEDGTRIPILYEDRAILAIDKPPGWMLIPDSWDKTNRNLQLALTSAVAEGQFWARSRGIKFLRYLHRLDGETSGILLFGRSLGAVHTYATLFESRKMSKRYLAVMVGNPKHDEWTCRQKLAPDPEMFGRIKVDHRDGKDAETVFRVLKRGPETTLVEAQPITGRTHQIRVHALVSGHPLVGDPMYGPHARAARQAKTPLALRAYFLSFPDPFSKRLVWIHAPVEEFARSFGFDPAPLNEHVRELKAAVRPPGRVPVRPGAKPVSHAPVSARPKAPVGEGAKPSGSLPGKGKPKPPFAST